MSDQPRRLRIGEAGLSLDKALELIKEQVSAITILHEGAVVELEVGIHVRLPVNTQNVVIYSVLGVDGSDTGVRVMGEE